VTEGTHNSDWRAMRAAERARRHAERAARRHEAFRQRYRSGRPPMFFGFVLLGLGMLFLLDNLDILEARFFFRNLWPLLIIGWGISAVFSGGGRFFGWLAIGVGTVLLGNRVFFWHINLWQLFWPGVMIAIGAHILWRAWHPRAVFSTSVPPIPGAQPAGAPPLDGPAFATPEPDAAGPDERTDSSARFKEFAMMGSVERRNISQTFRGGEATVLMGSVELDLRDCRMASNEVFVDVFAMMGSIEIRIPREWTVDMDSRVTAILGSFEDLTTTPVDPSPKRFIVRGSTMMGSVEIRN
jgi:hypothetical protein